MKTMKKIIAFSLCLVMLLFLTACSSNGDSSTGTDASNGNTGTQTDGKVDKTGTAGDGSAEAGGETAISDVSGTLKIAGPGLFTTVGETGTTDLVTGIQLPGYDVVVKRWNELYPNVKLEIETSPWDNWKAVLQTSALSGDVDVLLHGSSITAIAEPIGAYLDKNPEMEGMFSMLAMRRTEDNGGDFSKYIPYGLTVTANPLVVVIDKQIFEDYGVAVPEASWTFDDVTALSKKTTGKDPKTGNETYGISMLAAASANKNYIWASRGFDAPVFQFGKTLKETKADFTTDATKKVLNYITSLYAFSSPDYLEGLDTAVANTADNNLAMRITESPIDDYNKLEAAGLLDRFMFVPLPAIQSGANAGNTSSHMGDWNMAICNTSKEKDLAWEFIKFMVTDEVVQQWLVDCNSIPNNLSALPKLKENMKPEYYSALETVLQQQPLEFSASTNECYDSGNFGTFANDVTSILNEMFVGNSSADEAVKFVQKNLDDYMSSVQ
ncbi:extracellular solute-binding protein [Anaerocolumna sp. AGMB13025]|uniref:ABC transporter substrate-binding protein n=1 Tax=Anaerocolumna sp. AGMB13025 TaxID=3039116 RepID=UPI00241DBD0A|nr:extracellular solute-binding protein [Anaerocolumna sp. AGMB13025]WFR59458.1 extracellular solute-binding protein [Anaerocolumna sp. AGMB13025]